MIHYEFRLDGSPDVFTQNFGRDLIKLLKILLIITLLITIVR